jgi:predicted component of type VI protein secretion system
VLATLEMLNPGPTKGQQLALRTPLAHVGRGAHNDIRLADESVSETHAKLQRREDGWYVVDMNSTNGTYVGGTRIIGERRLDGAPDVRFGGMKMRFSPAEVAAGAAEAKGTRAIASVERPRKATAPAQTIPQPDTSKSGTPRLLWAVAALLLAAVVFVVLKGRA